MSSNDERKRQLRNERPSRERSSDEGGSRRRRLTRLGLVAILAAVVVVAAVVLSQSGEEDPGGTAGGLGADSREVEQTFAGIPQQGLSLGNPGAPMTMTEFADLQCPFCGDYAREVLPVVVERYVRSGRLRLEFRPLTFVGPDSERAGLAAAAASQQNRLWQFTDLAFAHQGVENSGYVTDDYLRRIAGATPGLDAPLALADSRRPPAGQVLAEASDEATRLGVASTPSFYLSRRTGEPRQLALTELTAQSFARALDEALARR